MFQKTTSAVVARDIMLMSRLTLPCMLILMIAGRSPLAVQAHIRLTFPPARYPDLDFLDSVRTAPPCGVPKNPNGGYQGGFKIELLNDQDQVIRSLVPGGANQSTASISARDDDRSGQREYIGGWDHSTEYYRVTLPLQECRNCGIRLVRQAKEWSAGSKPYLFWSCADVDIVTIPSDAEKCGGHGKWLNDQQRCQCDWLHHGSHCQYKDECWRSEKDCGPHGTCEWIQSTSYPKQRHCMCRPGYFGPKCEQNADSRGGKRRFKRQQAPGNIQPGWIPPFLLFTRGRRVDAYPSTRSRLALSQQEPKPTKPTKLVDSEPENNRSEPGFAPQRDQPNAETEPAAEVKIEPYSEPEPYTETEPHSASEPQAESPPSLSFAQDAQPRPEPEALVASVAAEPEPQAAAEPSGYSVAEPEPGVEGEPQPETEPYAESESTGEPEPESESESSSGGAIPEPSGKQRTRARGQQTAFSGHPMDCADMVIGYAVGDAFKVQDYYSQSRATPRPDDFFPGGRQSLTAAEAYEADGITTMRFRRKLGGGSESSDDQPDSDPADQPLTGEMIFVWAKGLHRFGRKRDHSALGQSDDFWDVYDDDVLKYHGSQYRGLFEVDLGNDGARSELERFPSGENLLRISPSTSGQPLPFSPPETDSSNEFSHPNYNVSWSVVRDRIQFQLNAQMSPGTWTGIGFNTAPSMTESDVITLELNDAGLIRITDRTSPAGRYGMPRLDRQQSDVQLINSAYTNGRLEATFWRKLSSAAGGNTNRNPRNLNLSSASTATNCVYVLFPHTGGRLTPTGGISIHRRTPSISSSPICFIAQNDNNSRQRTRYPNLPKRLPFLNNQQ